MFGLRDLLAPYPVETFLDENLGKKAFYQPGPADKFEGLFSWQDLNHLLNTARPPNSIKLVYQKQSLPRAYLGNLAHWLNEGATLVIDWLQLADEFVFRFCHELARDVNAPVNINTYVSCPSKQGFDLHFDQHDVFIVQTEGKKQWNVFEPTLVKTPIQIQEFNFDDCERPDLNKVQPYCRCVLDVGDILYIPRGHWHYAVAETPSIHLTVGIDPTCGIDLLQWITEDLMSREEFFRRDMPIVLAPEFAGPGGLQSLHDYVEDFKTRVKKALEREDLVDLIVQRCMLNNSMRREAKLPLIWDLENALTPDTKFTLLESQKALIRFDRDSQTTIVYLRGSVLKLEEFPEALVRALFGMSGPFSGESIVGALPQYSWEQVKALLTRMYQSGVIINVDEDDGPGAQVDTDGA